MKAVIPVAGAGVRLRPHTYTQPKPLIPIAGKPIISFIIDQLLSVGVEEFVFIIGYLGEKIQLYVEKEYPDLQKVFVKQTVRRGSAHAIYTAKDVLHGVEEAFIVFGDAIIDVDLRKIIEEPLSCIGVQKVAQPWEFGVVELASDGLVKRMIEKPSIPKSNLAMVGLYKIKEMPALLDAVTYNVAREITSHGEYQLTDALMHMLQKGIKFSTFTVDHWFDCAKKEVLLQTNALLLDKEGYASGNLPAYDNSIIIHPVSIGSGCNISNSIIGPHVTIGDHTTINYSIVKESIIGNYATIEDVVLDQSIVGSDAAIKGRSQSLNIGDNTEIDFS
ncbi:MAG TPA: glucose-1-phosphate thymidylyltransferase [Phaeodactylibacter sp.]|nr:glucose-1-phosphate thymidylyltransferase [Phaeodactylibacter sp.]